MVVQAVVQAQAMGMAKFRLPLAQKTPEGISMKLGIGLYDHVARKTTPANPYGVVTTWVVLANM